MSRSQPRVTLAMLNYNGRELLDVVVPSVLALRDVDDARVVVVDNGSSDGSAEYIRASWPTVEVLEIPDNVGVAAALNRALAAAESELVALLNNDIELEPDWLTELSHALEAHPEAVSASGKLLRFHDRSRIDAAGDLMLWSGAVIQPRSRHARRWTVRRSRRRCSPRARARRSIGAALSRWSARSTRPSSPTSRTSTGAYGPSWPGSPRATSRRRSAITWVARPRALARASMDACNDATRCCWSPRTSPATALLRHGWKIVINQLLWLAASVRDGMLREHLRAWLEWLVHAARRVACPPCRSGFAGGRHTRAERGDRGLAAVARIARRASALSSWHR